MMKLSVQTALAAAILLAGCGLAGRDEAAPADAPGRAVQTDGGAVLFLRSGGRG